jgi:PAS domain S-box-containing protein
MVIEATQGSEQTRGATEGAAPALREIAAYERLHPHVDNITDYAIFMLDPHGRVASWNAGARRIKGYEAEEIIGRHFSMFYVDDGEREAATTHLLSTATTSGHAVSEGWRVRKDGEKFWASVVITAVFTDDELIGFSKVTRDLTDQKRANDELRLSEERYRLLVDGVREYAIFGLDPSGCITSWNAGAARTKGYTTSEVIGKHFSIFYPVLDIAAGLPQQELDKAASAGRHESQGWRLRKDGERFWAHIVLTAIQHEGGLLGYSKVTQDISARRLTEEALRRSEERYRSLIASVQDYAILALDPDGAVVSWNAGAERIKGYRAEEILGRHFSSFYPPADIAQGKPQEELRIATREGRFEEEGWRVRKDGTRFWAHVVITAMRDGDRIVGFSKVSRDVTERKIAEASLRSAKHLLEASHAMSKLGGWEIDLQTDEMIWTDQTYRIHDVSPETHRPSLANWLAFFPPEAIMQIGGAIQKAMHDAHDFSLELPFATASGKEGWVHLTSRVVLEHGKPTRIAGAIQDVTDRKQAELEVRQLNASLERRVSERTATIREMNEQLVANERALQERAAELALARDAAVEANRIKAELLANLSHEIRTPLATVVGLSDVLGATELTEEQAEFVRAIRSSGSGLLSVLNDILDFSKLEAGKLVPETRPFSVAQAIEDSMDVVAVAAAEKNLDLAWWTDGDDVPAVVSGDFARLRQVVTNLLSNAVKFTPRGHVTLTVHRLPEAPLSLAFTVRDTGIGISPEHRHRIFQSFSQVDGSTAREFGGTGLGLAMCRALCTTMGGGIRFESEPGRGSTFTFWLPFQAASSAGEPKTTRARPLEGRTTLLVQTSVPSREALARQLRAWGGTVLLADSAEEARRAVSQGAPPGTALALVIVDPLVVALPDALRRSFEREGAAPPALLELRWRGSSPPPESTRAQVLWRPLRSAKVEEKILQALSGTSGEAPVSSSERPRVASIAPPVTPLRVLVVEDNRLNQLVATNMLTRLGHAATVVADGHAVLRAIESEAEGYDVILMDVHLPGLDGLETTRRLLASRMGRARPRIIAMTANALHGDRERCLDAGMDDYLAKPVELAVLARALGRHEGVTSTDTAPLAATEASAAVPPTLGASANAAKSQRPPPGPRDAQTLRELAELRPPTDPPLVKELALVFLAQAPRTHRALEEAVEQGQLATAAALAHTLRGSSVTLGALTLSGWLEEIEQAAGEGDRAAVWGQLPRLRALFAEACAALQALSVDRLGPQEEASGCA